MMYFGLNINNRRKPWNDARVRRAAAMAINREEVNKVVFYGLGGDAGNPFAHLPPPYNKIKVELPPYDPEAAKQLLADAGYKDGFDEVLVGCPAPEERKAAEVVAAQLSKVGIRCKVDLPEIGRLLDLFFVRKDFSICLCGGDGQIDPDGYFHAVYDPLPDCVSGYDNPKVTAMMEQQRREIDPEKRVQLWTEIFDQVLVKDVYTIWLNFRPMFFLYRRYVKGFDWGLDRRMKFHSIWLEK
jgi:peptide/nickel transport system substrate-binding protein